MIALTVAGVDLTAGVLALGLFSGMTYAMLAAGLVLVYRSSRFINFAHSAVGLFGAAFLSVAVSDYGVPYWAAAVFAVLVGMGAGSATHAMVVRPLAGAPKVLSMVATLGASTFFVVMALAVSPDGLSGLAFPEPAGMPTFEIGELTVTRAYAAQAIISPVAMLALGWLLARTATGRAIRAAASNADTAATIGLDADRMAARTWAMAGGFATLAVALTIPTRGVVTPESFGPELLLRGLAAAAIARFTGFGVAIAAAIGIGVVEQALATNPDANGLIEVLILVAVCLAVLADRRRGRAAVESWGMLGSAARLPDAVRRSPLVRRVARIGAVAAVVIAASVPWFASGSQALDATIVIALAVVGLSVTVVTGLGGQLSLAQFGFAAIAAAVSVRLGSATHPVLGVVVGIVSAGVAAALVAIPALRVRGPQLGVATLSFSLVTSSFLLNRDWLLGDSPAPARPGGSINGIAFDDSRGYYWLALAGLLVALGFTVAVRRSPIARVFVAVRDNDEAARAMSIPATRRAVLAAAIGGLIAGLGGVIYGHAFTTLAAANFPVSASIDAVTAAVVGGLGSVAGPLLGALYLRGIPAFFSPTAEALAGLSASWLILLVSKPSGLAGLVGSLRDKLARWLAARDPARPTTSLEPPAAEALPAAATGGAPVEVRGVSRRFGAVTAVDDVTLTIDAGEIVGLIGPNGAGKTTLFELISGFVTPTSGSIIVDGRDLTGLSPDARARLGVSRTFQSALLYPTLTVAETVMVAMERSLPSSLGEIVGAGDREAQRRAAAIAVITEFGLDAFANTVTADLPTGTRRTVELACAVAQRPQVMLLDEPTAGVPRDEAARIIERLRQVSRRTGATIVVIEHDTALLASLCDRLVAMHVGAVIADGPAAAVQADPAVVGAYLG